MDPERWGRVRTILEGALERPPDQRAAYLDDTCGNDQALRREVSELLAEDETTNPQLEFLDQSPTGRIFGKRPAQSLVGEWVGDYRVRRVIGTGGMGTVFEAVQEEPRRVVALKVMGQGILSTAARRRFRYESEVLARLHHPGIAQVYGAGTHKTQAQVALPWFAMELVEGARDLLSFANDEDLTLRQRVELMVTVCEAVHHGHQKGIIHRDLKPSNILVSAAGRPTIIDFGIARCTDTEGAAQTLHTKAGLVLGTLHYMSPEQVEGRTEDLDIRTDVYSLGVVGYQLLAGRLPYELADKTLPEATRLICEVDPKPIGAYDTALRGDPETIVGRAMAKERERRYASVADLGRDLENFLADRPILARPPSAIYQLRKFTRRNRALMTAVMLILVLIIGGVIAVGWQNIQIREAKAQADTEKVRAEKATSFLTQVISEANALDRRGPDFTVREALEEAAGRIETELADQPLIAADIHQVIGVTFRKMSLYNRADTHLTTAWTTHERLLGADHKKTIQSLGALSFLRWQQDRRKEAVKLGQHWLAASQRVLGEDDPESLAAAHTMALYLAGQGRVSEAEAAYRRTLAGRRQILGQDDEATLQTMHNLGRLLMDRGEFEAAARILDEVLETRKRVLGQDHADTLMTNDLIGELLQERGRIPEAEAIHERTLAGLTKRLGPEHVATLGAAANLIVTRMRMAKMTDLEILVPKTLAGCKRVLGDGHRYTLMLTRIMAALRMQQGRLDESIELFREAYAATHKAAGEDEQVTRRAASDLAYALQADNRFEAAVKVTQPLVQKFASDPGQLDESHASVLLSHGLSLIGLRRFEDAEKALLRCREVSVAAKSEQSQAALAALNSLVRLYTAWGKPEEARRYQKLVDEWGR